MKEKHIYQRVRDLREDSELTQEAIAKELKLHVTQYRRWETGESEIPTHIIVKLCNYYNVSADYMLGITQTYKPKPKK